MERSDPHFKLRFFLSVYNTENENNEIKEKCKKITIYNEIF